MGRIGCDLILKNARYLDVFACRWVRGELAVIDGVIVGLESGLKAKRTIDLKGKSVVPGFVDAHVHVESSLLVPAHFEGAVVGRGTTTAICDPHELTNVAGLAGLKYFLNSAEAMNLDLRVMLSSCVPATHLETNGGGRISAKDLLPLADHPKALGLAEMMNMPGVINNDPKVLEKLLAFEGKVVDGHAPMMKGRELSAYAAAGISSCHESTQLEEAREKLGKGMSVWIREGSVAKDLEALVPLLDAASSPHIGFCTDDRNPLDIVQEGHIDFLVRGAISSGVAPEIAYRSASWSVARHYGLRGKGSIAPGSEASLVVLGDAQRCEVESVFLRGTAVSELETPRTLKGLAGNSIRVKLPQEKDLEGPQGLVHVIVVKEGSILTGRETARSDARGIARLSVCERYGKGKKPANGYARGFGENFRGAIASSVGHDSHNLIVVGDTAENMRVALASLIESGGGFSVVKQGKLISRLPLPLGGLMTTVSSKEVENGLLDLRKASRAVGCELGEPFLQLAFLSLPVIPSLKLTDLGLVDVEQFKFIDVRAA